MKKTSKQLERYFKGVASSKRLDILFSINRNEGISVDGIAEEVKTNFKTTSEHTRRLVLAGLVNKKYQGRQVTHNLSPYGKKFIKFIETFQHS